ncbi:cell wall-binding repeat-containing protein [Isachenkonia alkalipeptolytica]|uniref:Cell wall-binding repeat-containing protein n=1 Tax=Isachenkonia alkalipeptolytica TaxID=2565777 RepID=A0AA43XL75_9CLOT|nr:cell wall-binding repeat-containing protein [Isachenkonia alkalipeptolytica]NBG88878.1 hypothetical protein [Isachenkonia alkalipeptolytica]
MKKVVWLVLVVLLVFSGTIQGFAEQEEVVRLAGDNRYQTAVAISEEGWTTSEVVVLARGDGYADALAGVPLAYAYDAPILLTQTNRLNPDTLKEMERLQASKVIILGGEGAVSTEVQELLKSEGFMTERISGSNRYTTATKIAYELQQFLGVEGFDSAVMVYGQNFPDALAVASHAARLEQPIFLTNGREIHPEVEVALEELSVEEMAIIGGETVISDDILRELDGNRVAGVNRYETALAVAEHFQATGEQVYIATGLNFADAVTGGVLAAKNRSSLLLVSNRAMPESVRSYIDHHGLNMVILGGENAVPDFVWQEDEYGTIRWDGGRDDVFMGTYTGDLREGIPHGYGEWIGDEEGRSYVGQWKEGVRHGEGLYTWPNGDCYDGEYYYDTFHGYGELSLASGYLYQGYWEDGKEHGQGTASMNGFLTYEGIWDKGNWNLPETIGDRQDPSPPGVVWTLDRYDWWHGENRIEMQMLDLVSGPEAWEIVQRANMYNEAPPSGKEYVLVKFGVYVESTEDGGPLEINFTNFDVVSSDGVLYNDWLSVAGLDPRLDTEIYPGGYHEGWVPFIVRENDHPVLAMDRGEGSEVWFDLRPRRVD